MPIAPTPDPPLKQKHFMKDKTHITLNDGRVFAVEVIEIYYQTTNDFWFCKDIILNLLEEQSDDMRSIINKTNKLCKDYIKISNIYRDQEYERQRDNWTQKLAQQGI